MPHQQYQADVALEIDPDTGLLAYSEVVIIGPRQVTGKALDVATPLWTQRGWVPMGEMRVGDQVAHPAGHFTDVVFTSEVMTGHDCYEVVTSDGRSVVADADHLWRVRDTYSGGVRPWRTMTTAEIVRAGLRNRGVPGGWRFRLPIQDAVKTADVDLPLDPYLFGVWLGDGSSYKGEVTSADPEVFGAFAVAGFVPSYSYPTGKAVTRGLPGLVKTLRGMGVLAGKWVPEPYLLAGYGQRLALLQGLMDTDGCITENHGSSPRCEFTSSRRQLADAVLFLVRSLGWRASLIEGRATLYGRDCGPKWRVGFTATTDDPCPFRLPRKASMVRAAMPRTGMRTAVSIIAIRPIESRPVRCIKVAAPDGLFLAGRDLVATHNTEFILPILTHRCIGFGQAGPQRVMYTAQTADAAKEKWRDVHMPRLKSSSTIARRFKERRTANQEAFLWDNGSIWAPGSTTGKSSGTGDSLDVGVIDEAWSRPDMRTELGMRPAMMTRDWKQLYLMSMIPGLSRAEPGSWPYLMNKRQIGRARVDADVRRGMAYFEYSADESLDPGDPNTWWSCMPGLGRTVREPVIAEDFDALDLVDFCAEYLGWAPATGPTARWTLIPKPLWEGLRDPLSEIVGRPALAVEISEDRTRAFIGAAGRRWDGHRHVEVVEPGGVIGPVTADVAWVEPRLLQLIEAWKPCTVVVDPRRPANSLVAVLKRRGIDVTTPNQNEIAGACGRFVDATGANEESLSVERVFHLGQPELDDALAHSRKLETSGGGFTIVGKGHSAQLGALYACILAMHGHDLKGFDTVPEPDIFV